MRKHIIKGIVALALAVSPALALAAPSNTIPGCDIPPDHGISNEAATMWVSCIKAADWDAAVAAQQHGADLPVFVYPATVTDKYGITYTCEAFLTHGCVDATKTPEYDAYIRALGTELVHKGYTPAEWPRFAGVMQSVSNGR